jgi:O-Antigen ligase
MQELGVTSNDQVAGPGGARAQVPGLVLLAVLSGVWAWWAWQEGAYFGVVLLPGAIVLCLVALLFTRLAPWPPGLVLSRAAVVALAALCGLGVWALLSALWSPAPDAAVADGQRILTYALAFGLGIWLCTLLGERMNLSLVPLAFAAAVAGTVAVVTLMTSTTPRDLLDEGTIEYPLGYRNAEAAFFGIALFCALGLASDRRLAVLLRALALGVATLCLDLFLLAQSRGSVLAMGAALVVYTLAAPKRVRALSWLALALLPAAGIIPALTSLYHAAQDGSADAVSEMHTAGAVAALTVGVAILLGGLAASFERRLPGLGSDSADGNRAVGIGLVALALASAAAFVIAVGDPVDWLGKRAHEFRKAGSPDLSAEASRFGFNAGSDRYDLWRVALDDAEDDPLLGDGGGGYQFSYLRHRELAFQQVHDAHSIELETLAEFGVPGLILLLTALAAAGAGAVGVRRSGPPGDHLAAIALASGTYWLVHCSIDWFWPYPAVTAPVIALLGSAGAARLRPAPRPGGVPWRLPAAICVALLAVSAVPPFLSERYVNQAYADWRTDIGAAYDDLDRAGKLNRLSDTPLLAEAAIAIADGDRERALTALREAEAKRPEEWATHFLLARLQLRSDPAEARRELRIALELNPLEYRVRALAENLELVPSGG